MKIDPDQTLFSTMNRCNLDEWQPRTWFSTGGLPKTEKYWCNIIPQVSVRLSGNATMIQSDKHKTLSVGLHGIKIYLGIQRLQQSAKRDRQRKEMCQPIWKTDYICVRRKCRQRLDDYDSRTSRFCTHTTPVISCLLSGPCSWILSVFLSTSSAPGSALCSLIFESDSYLSSKNYSLPNHSMTCHH